MLFYRHFCDENSKFLKSHFRSKIEKLLKMCHKKRNFWTLVMKLTNSIIQLLVVILHNKLCLFSKISPFFRKIKVLKHFWNQIRARASQILDILQKVQKSLFWDKFWVIFQFVLRQKWDFKNFESSSQKYLRLA